MNRRPSVLVLLVIAWLASESRAEAYVDPATGSYILQLVIAGALGALFTLKLFWRRLVGSISAWFRRSAKTGHDEA